MAPKKKKKSAGGNKKAKTVTKEDKPLYLPLVYDIPKYEDPLETTPKVTVVTALAEPATPLFCTHQLYIHPQASGESTT